MRRLPLQRQTLILLAVLVPLLLLFVYVTLRSGPLAPVPVTLATVGDTSIAPGVFGIGVVESRYTYKIGPTVPGRLQRLSVDVGDRVRAAQVMGTMDPVDLDDRLRALDNDAQTVAALGVADVAAQGTLASVQRQYGLGAASYVQVLGARQQAAQVRLSLDVARVQRLSDSVALFQAVGGGGEPAAARGSPTR